MKVAIGEIWLALRKYNMFWRSPLWRYRYFWRSHQAAFCQGWSHVSSLCSFELIIKGVWWTLPIVFFFFVKFNRIDEIAVGFPSQVDFRKLWNIMCKLSMLQKVPTRHSPNVFIYKLKCTKSANVVSTLSKWGLTRPSKIMVPWKWWSSKYVVFPERQPYFTYVDLLSSGLKIHAFQLTTL